MFEGYSSSLQEFITETFWKIKSFNPWNFQKEFDSIKGQYLKDKQNFYFGMPVQQAFEYLNTMMIKGRFDHKLCIENEGLVPFDTFCEMNETFLKNGFTEWFIYGNATKDEA